MTTLATSTRATTSQTAPEGTGTATVPPAAPVRVSVAELAGSVVLLAAGRSLDVSDQDAPRWRAVVNDTSVATVRTTTSTWAGGRAGSAGADAVCALQAAAPGRTRGYLVDTSGQRLPFEVVVVLPRTAPRSS